MDGEIIFNIDVMLAKRKMSVTELANKVGITLANISVLKNGKAKAIRVSTLAKLCEALDCQPADLLEYRKTEKWQKIPLSLRGVLLYYGASLYVITVHSLLSSLAIESLTGILPEPSTLSPVFLLITSFE